MGIDENQISLRPSGGCKLASNENQISLRPGGGSKWASNKIRGDNGLPLNSFRPEPLHSSIVFLRLSTLLHQYCILLLIVV